ncbi:hypothetical protein ACFXTH_040813 [Malus domestica]
MKKVGLRKKEKGLEKKEIRLPPTPSNIQQEGSATIIRLDLGILDFGSKGAALGFSLYWHLVYMAIYNVDKYLQICRFSMTWVKVHS